LKPICSTSAAGSRVLADQRVVDGDDVRVADLAGERGLVLELLAVHRAELRVAEHLGLDRLQRDDAAGERVLGEIHGAGRALAERGLHLVLADLQRQAGEADLGLRGYRGIMH
jgi:hypothetical protein